MYQKAGKNRWSSLIAEVKKENAFLFRVYMTRTMYSSMRRKNGDYFIVINADKIIRHTNST